jgi:hypothetical protein
LEKKRRKRTSKRINRKRRKENTHQIFFKFHCHLFFEREGSRLGGAPSTGRQKGQAQGRMSVAPKKINKGVKGRNDGKERRKCE